MSLCVKCGSDRGETPPCNRCGGELCSNTTCRVYHSGLFFCAGDGCGDFTEIRSYQTTVDGPPEVGDGKPAKKKSTHAKKS